MITMKQMTGFNGLFEPADEHQPVDERRTEERRDFSYYMQVIDNGTQETVGHMADISPEGFKLDSQKPLPLNKDFRFRMELTQEVADQSYIVFMARSKWCLVDPLDPFLYNVGFQLINISPSCYEIFSRMMEKYGRKHEDKPLDLRHSNLW